jgi:aspartyl-tRNA(Asn)/glutamyl-tRNA(Gln) amidotransferase subunit C
MNITRQEVEHIATLSYLKLSEEEVTRFQRELSSVLSYIDKLNQADTSNVSAAEHPFAVPQRLREDIAGVSCDPKDILKNVPHSEDGFILVPKVIQ